jgi:hypothetical protein
MRELFGVDCLILGAWFTLTAAVTLVRGLLSRSWPMVTGVVRASRVLKKLNSEGDEVSRRKLEYSYSVNGKTYRGTRMRFGAFGMFAWSANVARALQRGDEVSVFHSPSHPSVSVLQRGVSPLILLPLAVGIGLLWAGLWVW